MNQSQLIETVKVQEGERTRDKAERTRAKKERTRAKKERPVDKGNASLDQSVLMALVEDILCNFPFFCPVIIKSAM